MNDIFEIRIRAAAKAGWWILLIFLGTIYLQYGAYLLVMSYQPTWFLSLCGPNLSWIDLQNIWLLATVALKLIFWVTFMGVLWLTLWKRQLRKELNRLDKNKA